MDKILDTTEERVNELAQSAFNDFMMRTGRNPDKYDLSSSEAILCRANEQLDSGCHIDLRVLLANVIRAALCIDELNG